MNKRIRKKHWSQVREISGREALKTCDMKHVLAHRLLFNEKIIPGSGIYKRIFDRDNWYIYRGIVKVADQNGKRTKRGICRRTRWEHNVPYFPLYEALVGSEPVMDLPRYDPYG